MVAASVIGHCRRYGNVMAVPVVLRGERCLLVWERFSAN